MSYSLKCGTRPPRTGRGQHRRATEKSECSSNRIRQKRGCQAGAKEEKTVGTGHDPSGSSNYEWAKNHLISLSVVYFRGDRAGV